MVYGKGSVPLFASQNGFKRIIVVELSQELHRLAAKNIAIWNRRTRPSNIETVCMDATKFPIPNELLVVFFYSPFRGRVMEQVLQNISTSFAMNPREIVLIYYGHNTETIHLLKATNFHCRELSLRADWSRFIQYRSFLFTTHEIE